MRLAQIPRDEFLGCYFDYQPGEDVAFFEPTQQGKTQLAYQMLDVAMAQHPELAVASCMPKSVDPPTRLWAGRLDLKITDRWPPPARFPWQRKPRGHVLWPRHLKNVPVAANREHLAKAFRQALYHQFREGSSITLADDAYLLLVLLGLNPEAEEILTAGGSNGAGLWLTSQKPSGTRGGGSLTTFAYNAPVHIVLGQDPMPENRKRFADIGGIDAGFVADIVAGLRKHRVQTPYGMKNISEKLYIRKDGPYMCIVGL